MKIKLSKNQWEHIGKTARWGGQGHTQEAFWCLLAGMSVADVVSKYRLGDSETKSVLQMVNQAGKGLPLEKLQTKIKKEQLPGAYQLLWDKYHNKKSPVTETTPMAETTPKVETPPMTETTVPPKNSIDNVPDNDSYSWITKF